MEANSNKLDRQHGMCAFKFISEERLNYITQRVQYDQKKKLEDEAWFNFLARKDKSKIKSCNDDKPQNAKGLETKQNELKQSIEQPSPQNLPRSESNGNVSDAFSSIPKAPSFREHTLRRIGDVAELYKTQMPMLDTQLGSDCCQEENEYADSGQRSWDHSAASLHDLEVVSTIPLSEAALSFSTHEQHSVGDRRTMDHIDKKRNRTLFRITKADLEQLKELWVKIVLHLDGIMSLHVKAPEDEKSEDYLLRQLRATEFTAFFARNYVYSLRRKIQELHAGTGVCQNRRSANKLHISLVAAHQAANKALITYLKRMPCPVGVGVPDKLSELLHLIIDMCAICSLFAIESAELKKGPDEVENKCQFMLIEIQELINQHCMSIDEKHSNVLSTDNKKVSTLKPKKKLNYYSLSMYKPKVGPPLRAIPKGYKNKIQRLAQVKFGLPPKANSEALQYGKVAIEHNLKRHHAEVLSPRRMQKTAKVKKPHRSMRSTHDSLIEVGKFDDSDNIQTLVELFGKKEDINDPEETQPNFKYVDKRMNEKEVLKETNETKREEPDAETKVDSALHTHKSEKAMFSKQQAIKLGVSNAQLILLPPYQLPTEHSKQLVDDQHQTCRQHKTTLRQGERQQRFRHQQCSRPMRSEPQNKSPKVVETLNRSNDELKHEDNGESQVSLTRSPRHKVRDACYQTSPGERFQAVPSSAVSDKHLISEQAKIIENISASILNLNTSHANMTKQISDLHNQQQEFISAQVKRPQTPIGEKCNGEHESVLLEQNNSARAKMNHTRPAPLDVSDQQLSAVLNYLDQCEDTLQTSLDHKQHLKPWRVLNVLSNQIVDSALRSIVEELDFDALLSNMYKLEFQ